MRFSFKERLKFRLNHAPRLAGVRAGILTLLRLSAYERFRRQVTRLASAGPRAEEPVPEGGPLMSILLLREGRGFPERLLASLRSQDHWNWEVCADSSGLSGGLRRRWEALAREEARVRFLDLPPKPGESRVNRLAAEARGDFVAVAGGSDVLEPHALRDVAAAAARGADLVYTDEDFPGPAFGFPRLPRIKPDWAPETLRAGEYAGRLCAVRRDLFFRAGGWNDGFAGAAEYDFFLRVTEITDRISHVPRILLHRGASPAPTPSVDEGRALQAHLDRSGGGRAERSPGGWIARYPVKQGLSADIVIPSANHEGILERSLATLLEKTEYSRYGVIVMLNGPGDFSVLKDRFSGDPRVRFEYYSGSFNYSRINNVGASKSEADVLVFLNDDIEVVRGDWLTGLLEQAQREGVGAAGAMLLYPDGTLQHGGILLDPDHVTWEFNKHLPAATRGILFRPGRVQNVSAVTGACLATKRADFSRVGGFDENLPVAFNDVDYCLKLLAQGLRVVYLPHVCLIHHESRTRGPDVSTEKHLRLQEDTRKMIHKWGRPGLTERYYDARIFRSGADLGERARASVEPQVFGPAIAPDGWGKRA